MGMMKQYKIEDCFTLRARIGWQGLRAEEFTDYGPYLVTGTDFKNGKIDWDTCYHVEEHRYKQDRGIQLREHDLLITKDGTIGKTAVVHDCPEKTTLNSGVFVVRAINDRVVPEFLYYILNSRQFELFMRNILTGSTIKHLNQEHFYKFYFDAPDISEQQKIAEILSTVDEAIDKTRALIEKYTNVKAGMMQDLLTNGIDENGVVRSPKTHKYKDSPLGHIPVEWECKRIDKVMPLQRGHDLPQYNIKYGEFPVACSNGIIALHNEYTVKGPCVWTGRSGTIGNVFYSEKNCWIHNTSLWVTNFCGNDEKFIYYLLNSFDIKKFLAGTGVPTLNRNDLHYQKVILPNNKDEQRKITNQLLMADQKIQTERDYLAKLQNIKQGLMQDLLTNTVSVDTLLSKGRP